MTEDEGLSLRATVDCRGSGVTVREIARLMRLTALTCPRGLDQPLDLRGAVGFGCFGLVVDPPTVGSVTSHDDHVAAAVEAPAAGRDRGRTGYHRRKPG